MKKRLVLVLPGLFAFVWAGVAASDAGAPPWKRLYSGEEASGAQVMALWQFLPGRETADTSGRGRALTLRGDSRFADDGPVEGTRCLESFATDPKDGKGQGAMAAHDPTLTPTGAFTMEWWMKPKAGFEQQKNMTLLDKMYVNYKHSNPAAECQRDYMVTLDRSGEGAHVLNVFLGHGDAVSQYTSTSFRLTAGEWRHAAFTYNGAGLGRFFVDGKEAGRTANEGRGPVVGGKYSLAVGDRSGSSYSGFPGFIGQVRMMNGIAPTFAGRFAVRLADGRRVFERFEEGARLKVVIVNDGAQPMEKVRVSSVVGGQAGAEVAGSIVAAGGEAIVELPFDTRLRPDDYTVRITVAGVVDGRDVRAETETPVALVPRLPLRMPVVLWGGDKNLGPIREIGFTHEIFMSPWSENIWKKGAAGEADSPARLAAKRAALDEHLRLGLRGTAYTYEPHYIHQTADLIKQYGRVNRLGAPMDRPNVCGNFPEIRQYCYNTGAALARAYSNHPAFDSCLIHSEERDASEVCFHDHDRALYRKATGREIPENVSTKYGVRYSNIPGFPADRVVADDDPLLLFYRWFWKDGDAWNLLHDETHRALKAGTRPGFWTFYDPVTRVPPLWGSGGKVDVVSTWTYTYPDPIKMGTATDEVLAMAEGTGQIPMKMTQIIWYRSETAPKLPEKEADRTEWEKKQPDVRFITIAPDHLREAFWCKLARPIAGIMYHGYASLEPTAQQHSAYKFTDIRAKQALTELVRDVVRPYGPMLLQVPDPKNDVALLQSFTSCMLAGRGSFGWGGGWDTQVHMALQYAQLQPKIIYEEHIQRDGLDGIKVLVLPHCDVLSRSIVARIKEFQKRGGVVIADNTLCPAITPDILLPVYARTGQADKDKEALQKLAAQLRSELDPFYTRHTESNNPDVVTRYRRYGNADYVFAINDKRAFGTYVGHHRKVMEDGVPAEAGLTIRRPGAVVYDVLAHSVVPTTTARDEATWAARFGPGEGRLYLVVDRPISSVSITPPAGARLGQRAALEMSVLDDRKAPVAAVLPVQVDIRDPAGRTFEVSGYYGAKDGRLSLTLDLAPNDLAGEWKASVRELTAGLVHSASFRVAGPAPN